MQLWSRFRRLFEEQLEQFLQKEFSLDAQRFFSLIKTDAARGDDDDFDSGGAFASTLNAAFRFENFVAMMQASRTGDFAWHWL